MKHAGQLLVAPPIQEDEFWSQSVVILYEESPAAVVGLVLNKPSERTVEELAEHQGLTYSGEEKIYVGGPVNPAALVMLHTDDWTCSNTMHIKNGLRISSDGTMIQRLCEGDRPKKWRLFLGMSGWTPKQIDAEINGTPPYTKKASWLVTPVNSNIIFEKDDQTMWKRALNLAIQEATASYFHID